MTSSLHTKHSLYLSCLGLVCFLFGFQGVGSTVIDLTTGVAPTVDYWMETGFVYLNNYQWKTVTTTVDSFTNPLVFLSIPPIEDAVPTAGRLQAISLNAGKVTFSSKLYLVDDGNCSTAWYTPVDIAPDVQVGYMVIETGVYSITDNANAPHYFFIFQTSLTRPVSAIVVTPGLYDSPVFINTAYPSGCIGVTTNCRFPMSIPVPATPTTGLGMVTQIQSLVNDRFLMVRGVRQRRQDIMLALSPHDPLDQSYLVIKNAETVGVIAYETPISVNCQEGIAFESFTTKITSTSITFTLAQNYVFFFPGVYGMLSSFTSFTDSTGVRVFEKSFTQFKVITQEDQCIDSETDHTTEESITCIAVGQVASTSANVCLIRLINPLDTKSPTSSPTDIPSSIPTSSPTSSPTFSPSSQPTSSPTSSPSFAPTFSPTGATGVPTANPTFIPSRTPTLDPTFDPTSSPTIVPTRRPTNPPISAAPTSQMTCQDVLLYDLFGDGWGENIYLEAVTIGDFIGVQSNVLNFTVNCSCLEITICSQTGYFNLSIETTSGRIRHPWEIFWSFVDGDGTQFVGDIDSRVTIFGREVIYWDDLVVYNSTLPEIECDHCPHLPKPKPSKKSSPPTPSTDIPENTDSQNSTHTDAPNTEDGNKLPAKKPKNPPAFIDFQLYSDLSTGWFYDESEWLSVCPQDFSDLFPYSVVYPRYFITTDDRTKLIFSGALCLKNVEEICREILPPEGKFIFRVAGYERSVDEISWKFCGVEGTLGQELTFEMHHGQCRGGALLSSDEYCHGIVTLASFEGSLILNGLPTGELTDYDTVLLEHLILESLSVPSATAVISSFSQSSKSNALHVHFTFSAEMEKSGRIGTNSDVVESFEEEVYITLETSVTQGFMLSLLNQHLMNEVASVNDPLKATTSIELEYLRVASITYTDSVTSASETIPVFYEENTDSLESIEKTRLMYVYLEVAVSIGSIMVAVVLAVYINRNSQSTQFVQLPDSSDHLSNQELSIPQTKLSQLDIYEKFEEDGDLYILDQSHEMNRRK